VCGKGFVAPSKLVAHVVVHSGERPFTCWACKTTFTQSGSLYVHKHERRCSLFQAAPG